ncbi:MAG: hypothetical protein N2748_05185, partial [candidate division WOR-3 bacterium]|nr:hypothetical protein [candidate division WOR-3 bacterium]
VLDPAGIAISTASYGQYSPSVAFDGTNYLVVWEDRTGDFSDIYGARVSQAGQVIDSFPVVQQPKDQYSPKVVKGANNQMFITYTGWTDTFQNKRYNQYRIWGKFYNTPIVPKLVSPKHCTIITTPTPTFVWRSFSGGVLYNLVITGPTSVNIETSDTTYALLDSLGEGIYIWKVRAKDNLGNWTEFSSSWNFTILLGGTGWVKKETIPSRVSNKYVKDGGALVAVGDSLYAFRGNKSNEFYKYANGRWTRMESIPFGKKWPDTTKMNNKRIGKGASLCWNGDSLIYATRGNGTFEFWQYNINRNRWTQKAFGPTYRGLKGGTSITYYFDPWEMQGRVFLLVGSQKIVEEE